MQTLWNAVEASYTFHITLEHPLASLGIHSLILAAALLIPT